MQNVSELVYLSFGTLAAFEPPEGDKVVLFESGFVVVVEAAKAFSRPKQQIQK